ncbi:hypothetical protein FDECE_4886 [Fusarium decemcellulare]|nr:hypothetical protein FDECE_4886 [Fusarium decemcellulare]
MWSLLPERQNVLKTRVVQLESFISSQGLTPPEVRDEDRAVFEKLAPTLELLSPAQHDVQVADETSPDPERALPIESAVDAAASPLQLVSDTTRHKNDTIIPVEDRRDGDQECDPAHTASESMDDWVTAFMGMADVPTSSRQGDCFQTLPLDWDALPVPQPASVPATETEKSDLALPSNYLATASAHTSDGSNPVPCSCHFSEDDEELALQLSNRMGDLHLTKDGMSRFYGATSNYNFTRWKSPYSFDSQRHNTEQARAKRVQLDESSSSLETTLEELYFCWQDSAFHAIDRDMYHHGKKSWNEHQQVSTFYSPLLTNAICAFGALFHEPRRTSSHLADKYEKEAKTLLDLELDSPRVATVQALVALSTFEAASNRDARGWLYCAFDLGLHVDMGSYVLRGDMTQQEANARRTAFWGCYIVDHLWGFYLGRPFHTNGGNITVGRPWADSSKQQSLWVPYGTNHSQSSDGTFPGIPDMVDVISEKWVTLCGLMDALGSTMYGCNSASHDDLLLVAESTLAQLTQWKEGLPAGLQIDIDDTTTRYLPHLILLQINIQAISIIFSASLLLLFASLSTRQDVDRLDYVAHLDVCAQALAETGEYYEHATRSLDLLLAIKRDWKARMVSGGSLLTKRRRSVHRSEDNPPQKHFKMQSDAFSGNRNAVGGDYNVGEVGVSDDLMFALRPFDSVDWRYAIGSYHKDDYGTRGS